MALPGSGAISLSDFNTELGNAAGTTISLNSSDVRALLGTADGATASFSDYYGASSTVNIALTVASNTNNYNIFSNKGGSYVAGKTNVTITINSGVTVGSTSTGTYALDTGTGWATGDTITIINNGTVVGKGGDGGAGSTARVDSSGAQNFVVETNPVAGGAGGHAFRAQFATDITNNGTFAGGGGGGGGSGASSFYDSKVANSNVVAGGGGGGGAGTSVGSGGSAGRAKNHYAAGTFTSTNYLANAGSSGTATAGGALGAAVFSNSGTNSSGGGGTGGARGSAGADGESLFVINRTTIVSGASGGAAGNYAVGNSNITWSTTGTRLGGVS